MISGDSLNQGDRPQPFGPSGTSHLANAVIDRNFENGAVSATLTDRDNLLQSSQIAAYGLVADKVVLIASGAA